MYKFCLNLSLNENFGLNYFTKKPRMLTKKLVVASKFWKKTHFNQLKNNSEFLCYPRTNYFHFICKNKFYLVIRLHDFFKIFLGASLGIYKYKAKIRYYMDTANRTSPDLFYRLHKAMIIFMLFKTIKS